MARDLALAGALVVDGTGGRPRENVTVVLRDGRIASVGKPVPPADAEVIDLEGMTLLPGLIDAHTHMSSLDGVPESQLVRAGWTAWWAQCSLARWPISSSLTATH